MGLINLVEPEDAFWLLVSVDETDSTQLVSKVAAEVPEDISGWSAFLCKRMSADWFDEVRTKHTRWVADRSGRREETNWKAYRHELMDKLITEWRNIPGEPACTQEKKIKLPQLVQLLIIEKCSQSMALPEKGALQKNS